jgi:hypothetical protein
VVVPGELAVGAHHPEVVVVEDGDRAGLPPRDRRADVGRVDRFGRRTNAVRRGLWRHVT